MSNFKELGGFNKVGEYMRNVLLKEKNIHGCEIAVYRNHELLYNDRCGFSDYDEKVPMNGNELYYMYSCTKPITATAGMRLIEDGKLDPDAPVSDYLSEFKDVFIIENGNKILVGDKMKVRNLFTMTAGLNYNLLRPQVKALIEKGGEYSDTLHVISALAQDPLEFLPGDRFQYSLCHDALAAVIEAAADERFSDYLSRIMFKPLGMENATFHPTDNQKSRIAAQYASDGSGNVTAAGRNNSYIISDRYESGGAGLICGVSDYSKYADTLACGGTSADGYRLLKPETVKLLHTNQLDEHSARTFGCAAGPGYGYGMGVRTRMSTENTRTPLGEFGWDGAAGSYVMMDDVNGLSVFFAMHVLNWPACIGSGHAQMREYIYEELGL